MYIARSLVFYPRYFDDNSCELSDEIILPSYTFNHLMSQFDDAETLYITLTNVETNQNYMVTMGNSHNYDKNTIYVPQWILELIGCSGSCNSVIEVKKADVSECPAATKIVIKPLDPIAFEIDTTACFEKAFMNLHSIQEGITMSVPILELGSDYLLYAHIEKVEPANLSRIVAGEVAVEFINQFEDRSIIPTPNPMVSTESQAVTTSQETCVKPPELNSEEQLKIIREARLKRFQNNVKQQ